MESLINGLEQRTQICTDMPNGFFIKVQNEFNRGKTAFSINVAGANWATVCKTNETNKQEKALELSLASYTKINSK